ncbi:MAG: hypothetical protein AAFV53_40235 [Myxococcota bacterium]
MGQVFGEYTLSAVRCIVRGYSIGADTGADDSDFLGVVPVSDDVEVVTGAAGYHVYTDNGDDSHIATFRVLRASPAFRILSDLLQEQFRQRRAGTPISPINFRVDDPASGDRISSQHGVFLNRPEMNFNKSVGRAEFRIHLPKPKITYGANIRI